MRKTLSVNHYTYCCSINDNIVYQAILQPRQDIVEGLSADAILTTQSYLANYEEIMKELNGEDMAGSGIF